MEFLCTGKSNYSRTGPTRKAMRRRSIIVLLALLITISASHFPNMFEKEDSELKLSNENTFEVKNGKNGISNLSWGPNSGLNLHVDTGSTITMTVNISNGANITETVSFTISTETGWSCFWHGTTIPCSQPNQIIIQPGELGWPKFEIHVPPVVNGSPLAFVQHPFQLTAISSIDSAQVPYIFTCEIDEWFQAEFDSNDSNMSLEPGKKERTTLTLRNTGNSPAQLVARVVPLDSNNLPLAGFTPELSYQHEDWLVGVFNVHNLNGQGGNGIGANSQATIDIEIQPPSLSSGQMKVGVIAWSAYNPTETDMVIIDSSIFWERGGELFVEDDCGGDDIFPEQSCSATISITNTGNFQDSYEINVQTESWLNAELSRYITVVNKDETQDAATLTLTVEDMVPAFSHGNTTITLKLISGEILGSQTIELRVGPLVDWELRAVESSTDSNDNVSVAFTMRNLGNGDDGLQVTLHVDMSVEYGFIPPEQAEHGSETGTPRYFEIEEIPPGVNFTFRAWMHIPRNTEANGTITMTVEMQSTLKPEVIFTNISSAEYLAEEYRPENIQQESFWLNLEISISEFWNQFNGLIFTIIVTIIGGLGLLQALKHRQRKDAEWKAKMTASEPPKPEKPEQWMGKFKENIGKSSKELGNVIAEAPKVAGKVFKDIFTAKSAPKSEARKQPSGDLLDAANTVLIHHEKTKESDLIDDLASELIMEKEEHPANELFGQVESETGRTVRRPKRTAKNTEKVAVKPVKVGIAPPDDSSNQSATSDKKEEKNGEEEFDLDL